jgi:chromosome partitioning protein
MGYVIANASSKGGCGKSTITVALAGIYAKGGFKVLIIDADARKRLSDEWYDESRVNENIDIVSANHDTLRDLLVENIKKYQVLIIDVEGSASLTLAQAIQYADIVLVPANVSTQDVRDANKVVKHALDVNADSKKKRAIGVIWNRVPPAIKSREMLATMEQGRALNLPILFTIHERDAYKALFSYSTTLDRLDPQDVPSAAKAEQEIFALAETIGQQVREVQKEAA